MNSQLTLGHTGFEGEGNLDTSTVGSWYEEIVGSIKVNGVNHIRYERTIYCGNINSSNHSVTLNGFDLINNKILSMVGFSISNKTPVPYLHPTSMNYSSGFYINDGGYIDFTLGVNATIPEVTVTIEYYK